MSDDDLRAKLTKAYMAREGCERVVDDHFTSYCTEHHAGWLHDVNACAHADVTVTLALIPVVREALAAAWDEGYMKALRPPYADVLKVIQRAANKPNTPDSCLQEDK